jgi:hypothetical protein
MEVPGGRANCVYNRDVISKRPLSIILFLLAPLVASAAYSETSQNSGTDNPQDLVTAVKRLERKLGFRRTKSFKEQTADSAVSYRCYFTGKLELPDSYERLQLIEGTKAGCPLDEKQFDVFFYPLEAVGNGKSPVTASLANESVERFLVVIPHEDFHSSKELKKLPAAFGEASATLAGFLTAAEVARQKFGENSEVYKNLQREPEIFARKAEIVNRSYAQLREVYDNLRAGRISESDALRQKQEAFGELNQQCLAITPESKSFDRCPAVLNNAGLAFDETYTRFYPLMYQVYLAKDRALKPTLNALQSALSTKSEEEAVDNLGKLAKPKGN